MSLAELIFAALAIYGLSFLLKDSDGPFDIMNKVRRYLFANKYVGTFFFKLFDCYFCLGCHCGWIVYLLSAKEYSVQFFILWTLAGGVISLIMRGLLAKLQS